MRWIIILMIIFSLFACTPFNEDDTAEPEENLTLEVITIKDEVKFIDISTITVAKGYHEVTQEDIIRNSNITGDKIQVLGLKVGDSSEEMLSLLGEPDMLKSYEKNVFICEYNKAIGLKETGIIIKLTDDIIERLTVLHPFEPYLINGTNFLGMTKYDIYKIMGTPDNQYEEPKTRIFFYDETGIDILLYRKYAKGFSLRMPKVESTISPQL